MTIAVIQFVYWVYEKVQKRKRNKEVVYGG